MKTFGNDPIEISTVTPMRNERSWPMRLASDSDAGRIRHDQSRPREVSRQFFTGSERQAT